MRNHFLRAVPKGSAGIQYVGGYVTGFVGTTSNVTVTFGGNLTGGIASSASQGDLVLVFYATGAQTDRTMDVSGYTLIDERYANGSTYDTNLGAFYKFMGSTPDTSVTLVGGTFNANDAGAALVQVWRNVNTTTPIFEDSWTTALTSVVINPDNLANTPPTGYVLVACGAGAHARGGTVTYSSSDLTDFKSASGNDTFDVTIGGGYSTTSTNPASFTFSSTDSTTYSSAAVSISLNPM